MISVIKKRNITKDRLSFLSSKSKKTIKRQYLQNQSASSYNQIIQKMSSNTGHGSLVKKNTVLTLDPSGSANNFKQSTSGQNNEFSNEPNMNDLPPPPDIFFPINNIFPKCIYCGKRAVLDQVREVSGTQIFWACMLMCTLPCICWLPFCLGRCDDRRLECTNCREVRDYFQAPMCPCFCWHERLW